MILGFDYKQVQRFGLALAFLTVAGPASAQQHFAARGMILKVDPSHRTLIASVEAIPGFMQAMIMDFAVRDGGELAGLQPGVTIDFTLVIAKEVFYAEGIQIHRYEGLLPEPITAHRLKLLNQATSSSAVKPISIGERVPDFTLIDQARHALTFSELSGKTVVLSFSYTRCVEANFCFRISNNLGILKKRFRSHLGHDLVLLTVSFDPVHDQPEVLAKYAEIWKADPAGWHFLTGPADDVRRVCDLFGEDFFLGEGMIIHSLHTAIIDRHGKLVANLEGNEFTAQQLGDLVATVLNGSDVEAADIPGGTGTRLDLFVGSENHRSVVADQQHPAKFRERRKESVSRDQRVCHNLHQTRAEVSSHGAASGKVASGSQ
jgi:protein SCO1